ncbi:hypothetical protein WCE37_09745 [Luteimonas sp. MJ250]|uniref:hypothetical protein n=1 Tax=Luteimonas sp. MJ250 TaxID=3129236 RepID=UPI0031BAFE4E
MSRVRALLPAATTLALAFATACSPRGAGLEIDPARPACSIPKVVTVRWNLPPDQVLPASLMVNGPGKPMKSWRRATTHVGEADTGAWASDGLTITLVSNAGKPLARRTLTRAPCDDV